MAWQRRSWHPLGVMIGAIAKWYEEGRLTDTLHTIDFEHRLVRVRGDPGGTAT